MSSKLQHLLNILGCSRYGYIRFDQFLLAFISPVTQWLKTEKRFLEFVSQFNNQFMRQRAYVEILSTRKVWRARKRRKSCTRCSRVQLQPLESLASVKRLELHSAAPRATLTPLWCSPNFPRAQYLDIRTLTHELIVL